MKSPTGVHNRPVELARQHGLSAQAIRNYESNGVLPAAQRTPSGYRIYTAVHATALAAYLAQVRAYGYVTAAIVMRAVHRGDLDAALQAVDAGHALLVRDRDTLKAVSAAVGVLAGSAAGTRPDRALPVSAVAHRLGVTPATLRKWERAGILRPGRDRVTGHRVYRAGDVRDAELGHLLRRGGYPLVHIAEVLRHVRAAGGAEPLAASLADWRQRLTERGRAMLTAAARLDDYLNTTLPPPEPGGGSAGRQG